MVNVEMSAVRSALEQRSVDEEEQRKALKQVGKGRALEADPWV